MSKREHDEVVLERINNLINKVDGINQRLDKLNGKVAEHQNYWSYLKGIGGITIVLSVVVTVIKIIGG